MSLKRILLPAALLAVIVVVAFETKAHTLRVIATRGAVEPGRPTTIYLSWGHLLPVDELVRGDDLETYDLHSPSGSATPLKRDELSLQANALRFEESGVYQVAATRKMAIFTRYTDAEGKAVHAMQGKDTLELPAGAEIDLSARSRQFAKSIVVCGEPNGGGLVEPIGHDLEIVVESPMESHGYGLDAPIQVRVLFLGQPLAGATLVAASTTLNPDGLPDASIETDAEGRAKLNLFEPGTWVLEVYHRLDAPEESRHQYDTESFTASLTIPISEHE
ncbi:hypothetical protein BH23PLA1_BH23PLA1_03590 [soil metagenome]